MTPQPERRRVPAPDSTPSTPRTWPPSASPPRPSCDPGPPGRRPSPARPKAATTPSSMASAARSSNRPTSARRSPTASPSGPRQSSRPTRSSVGSSPAAHGLRPAGSLRRAGESRPRREHRQGRTRLVRHRRAWARRLGDRLDDQTEKAYVRLTGSAFGCDWLIARFDDLAADLEIPSGYWSRDEFLRALRLLGFEPKRIPPGHPAVATLYRASLAADKAPDPTEVDAFLHLDTEALEPEARAAEQRNKLGEREKARQTLLAFVRLEQGAVAQPSRSPLGRGRGPGAGAGLTWHRTFDASPEAALARRYESPRPWNCIATSPTSTAAVARRSNARRGAERTSRWARSRRKPHGTSHFGEQPRHVPGVPEMSRRSRTGGG